MDILDAVFRIVDAIAGILRMGQSKKDKPKAKRKPRKKPRAI